DVVAPQHGADVEIGGGDDDGPGGDRHRPRPCILHEVVRAECQRTPGGDGQHEHHEHSHPSHKKCLQPYCASFRISADAVRVTAAPRVEPFTSSRATGCSTMNANG